MKITEEVHGPTQGPEIPQLTRRRLPKHVMNRLHTKTRASLFLIEAPEGLTMLTPYDRAFEMKMEGRQHHCSFIATRCTRLRSD